jgi:hypothetical protein
MYIYIYVFIYINYIILYYFILFYFILYYIILFYIILYYIYMYSTKAFCGRHVSDGVFRHNENASESNTNLGFLSPRQIP